MTEVDTLIGDTSEFLTTVLRKLKEHGIRTVVRILLNTIHYGVWTAVTSRTALTLCYRCVRTTSAIISASELALLVSTFDCVPSSATSAIVWSVMHLHVLLLLSLYNRPSSTGGGDDWRSTNRNISARATN